MRLPTRVVCSQCGNEFPSHQVRRKVEAFARMGKGGTLSGIRRLQAHDIFLCDKCIDSVPGGASLFETETA